MTAGRRRSCCWTSTASRRSTTPSATTPATRCCARSRTACAACCAARTRWRGSAATSSRPWSRPGARSRRTPSSWRGASWPSWASRSRSAGGRFRAGASVGVALCPSHGRDAATLLKAADLALYRAKQDGRGRHRLFAAEMRDELHHRRSLERDLRHAAERGQLDLALPADRRGRRGPAGRRGGPAALAPPRARPRPATVLHPPRRGERPRPAARPLGARARLPRRGGLDGRARRAAGLGQPLPGPVRPRGRPGGPGRRGRWRRPGWPPAGSCSRSPRRC